MATLSFHTSKDFKATPEFKQFREHGFESLADIDDLLNLDVYKPIVFTAIERCNRTYFYGECESGAKYIIAGHLSRTLLAGVTSISTTYAAMYNLCRNGLVPTDQYRSRVAFVSVSYNGKTVFAATPEFMNDTWNIEGFPVMG